MSNPFDKYLSAEDKVHIAVCQYLATQYPNATVHHSPNEGKRSPFERYKIGKLGVSPGFPDLTIFYNRRHLALELKSESKSAKVSPNQLAWLGILRRNGWDAEVCYGFDEAKKVIDEWMKRGIN